MSDETIKEKVEAFRARYATINAGLPEAGGIAFCTVYSGGLPLNVTARANNPYDALASLQIALKLAQEGLGITLEKAQQSHAPAQEAPAPALPVGGNTNTINAIPVKTIKLASGGEHPRWVVCGGNYTKFGITCWPETLKAAGLMDTLDPMKDNSLDGNWEARYTSKDDGKPDKVVALVRLPA